MDNVRRRFSGRWQGAAVTVALLALAGWLTSRQLHDMDWAEVSAVLGGYSTATAATALVAALIGYIAISQYDLVGRHYTGHSIAVPRVMGIAFIGYTFSLNLGGMIGGIGFRYRLYSNAGLSLGTTTRVIGLSIVGNWSGYVLLAGLLFTFAPPELPPDWDVGAMWLQGLGTLLLLISGAYVWLCWRHAGRSRQVRNITLVVPSLGIAAVQFSLSLISWCANATILYLLLPDDVSWFIALAALLTSVSAALLAHVPGGIGVIELVFISMLGHLTSQSNIVAALLGYRCIYYLLPLSAAVLLYASMELLHRCASPRLGASDAPGRILNRRGITR